MALTEKQITDVCFVWGGSNQCRYIDEDVDDKGQIVHVCRKLSPQRQIIDDEIENFYKAMQNSGQDPIKQGLPLGDNCKGYILLKSKAQGYDV